MAYVSIDINTKKEIIKEYWAGKRITEIEKNHGVTRSSIRSWSQEADSAISSILKKRGVKDRTSELERENQDLKTKLAYLNKIYNKISQNSQEDLSNASDYYPVICGRCNCTNLWKNGTIDRIKEGASKGEIVQRYTCSNCKTNIYVVKKNST